MEDQAKMTIETQLLEDYKKTGSLISLEMLRSAFRPILHYTTTKQKSTGLRREDVSREVDALFEQAINAYDVESFRQNNMTLTTWVFECMKRLPDRLDHLREEITRARNRGS